MADLLSPLGVPLTDLANAERLVEKFGGDLRHVRAWRSWYRWDGTRWRRDTTGEAERVAKETLREMIAEAAALADERERTALIRHGLASSNAQRVRSMLDLAATEAAVVGTPDQFDAHAWVLNVTNGTLDLQTGELRPHRREDHLTKLAPVIYDPAAECPRWTAFLWEVFAGDEDVIAYVQRAVGYALAGEVREHAFFLFNGSGANGKTTLLETLRDLLGDYAVHTDFTSFVARRDGSVRNDIARLRGARLVTASEAEEGSRFAEALLKQITGGDMIAARKLYQEFEEWRPTFKLFLAANHRPAVWDTTFGFWRRVRLVPFMVTIPPEAQDASLREKLRAELPGILNWAVAGCRAWQQGGLAEPEMILVSTSAYQAAEDVIRNFLVSRCQVNPADPSLRVRPKELYAAYETWATDVGIEVVGKRKFNSRLRERGIREIDVKGETWWVGVTTIATATTSVAITEPSVLDEVPF